MVGVGWIGIGVVGCSSVGYVGCRVAGVIRGGWVVWFGW